MYGEELESYKWIQRQLGPLLILIGSILTIGYIWWFAIPLCPPFVGLLLILVGFFLLLLPYWPPSIRQTLLRLLGKAPPGRKLLEKPIELARSAAIRSLTNEECQIYLQVEECP